MIDCILVISELLIDLEILEVNKESVAPEVSNGSLLIEKILQRFRSNIYMLIDLIIIKYTL